MHSLTSVFLCVVCLSIDRSRDILYVLIFILVCLVIGYHLWHPHLPVDVVGRFYWYLLHCPHPFPDGSV